jgi:hypothetical protein
MRLKKIYDFMGTVKSAKGLWKNRVIGKPIRGQIMVTGQVDDFAMTINRVFRIGGKITEAPLLEKMFPGGAMESGEYPYVVGLQLPICLPHRIVV